MKTKLSNPFSAAMYLSVLASAGLPARRWAERSEHHGTHAGGTGANIKKG